MFERRVVIDGRGHLYGRLASIVAKQILSGQRVVVVRCEELVRSGSLRKNELRWKSFRRKRCSTNPKFGPIHFKSPSKMFWRSVRGMIPHKRAHGADALRRLKVFEGVPSPYDTVKKVVVPSALSTLRLKATANRIRVGDLSWRVGWGKAETVSRLEAKRKTQALAWYERKKLYRNLRARAVKEVSSDPAFKKVQPILAEFGY